VSIAIFRLKRAAGVGLARSAYLDQHGNFIKQESDLQRVRVTFADDEVVDLLDTEYRRLTTAEQDAVKNAGVSVSVVDNRDGE